MPLSTTQKALGVAMAVGGAAVLAVPYALAVSNSDAGNKVAGVAQDNHINNWLQAMLTTTALGAATTLSVALVHGVATGVSGVKLLKNMAISSVEGAIAGLAAGASIRAGVALQAEGVLKQAAAGFGLGVGGAVGGYAAAELARRRNNGAEPVQQEGSPPAYVHSIQMVPVGTRGL